MTFTLPDDQAANSTARGQEPAPKPTRQSQKRGGYRSHWELDKLVEFIKQRGEAVPSEMAKEFGWARSTLTYTLMRLLKTKRIIRMGGGRSIRYRVATPEDLAPKAPVPSQTNELSQQPPMAAIPEPGRKPSKTSLFLGFKDLLKKVLKG